MDYKIIIILIALLFLMILIYREVNELKDQWNKNMADMSVYLNQNNEKMLKTIQGNMSKYVTQIKGIGSENLQQLGKITLLNHQPIIDRKTANHFTETDISNYMSDRIGVIEEENEKIFEKKENSHYYMSEDTKKFSNNKGVKSIASDENAQCSISEKNNCENGICKIKTVQENFDDLIPLYIPPETEKELIPIYQQKNKESEKPQINQTIYPLSQINKSTNTLETSMIDEDDYEDDYEVSDNNTKKTNDNEIEIDIYNIINGNDIKNVIDNNDNDNDIYVDDEKNIDNEEKSGEILSSDTVNIEKNISKIDLTNSVTEILNDNVKPQYLKNIDEYDAQSLREMAKKLGIPTTYKEKNKVKQYRKQELYNNILSHLKNKSHQI
ncbi:hypothetical protein Klosneuvirus_1_168 [Klosneuvirus KNV1]|uniref:Uncharacterized protein n=1 Tax=Klosneuvirus KNV1 TaxID=1977640 RepID=A0A1V0SI21_9VIRU|nr:hypothetical protein Klosneuvirus_1_168 [Klosneuvirus KNV1]